MKERIILAPGINETELLRSLAKYNVNTFATRIMAPSELARLALSRSNVSLAKQEINNLEIPCIINSFIKEVDYFESSSFEDAKNLARTLNSIRKHILNNEKETLSIKLNKGEFINKNKAILEIYNKYTKYCEDHKLIDSIALIREALNCKSIDAEFICLDEFKLEPLDEELLKVLSNNTYKKESLIDLFNVKENKIHIERYAKCYGSNNEVEEVFNYIYKNNISLDECCIALIDPKKYSPLLLSYAKQNDIPLTLETGILISQTNPAKLLKLFRNWDGIGHHGIDSLHDIVFSESFNRHQFFIDLKLEDNDYNSLNKVIELAGSLRIDCNKDSNDIKIQDYKKVIENNDEDIVKEYDKDIINNVEILAKIFEEQIENFVYKYAKIRKGILARIDKASNDAIYNEIVTYKKYNDERLEELLKHIFEGGVGKEISSESCIHVCDLLSVLSSPRKHLFILGLSANNFPGNPKENYLLLDSDCELINALELTSFERVNSNKKILEDVIKLSSSLNTKIYLSYSSYDLAELKEQNASSILFDIYQKQNGNKVNIDDFENNLYSVPFFKSSFSNLKYIGESYNNEEELEESIKYKNETLVSASLDKNYSPSSIEKFFECPRRFYLKTVLGIKEPEEYREDQIIRANDFGSLSHAMMEHLAKDKLDEESFINIASAKFDEYITRRIPYSNANIKKEKQEFIDTLKTSYEEEPGNVLVSAEEAKVVTHDETGINLLGIPDRVEKDNKDNYLIVDFKTGRKVKHKENDVDTCLQVLIYAYIMGKLGFNISRGIYKYLRYGKEVECVYNENSKAGLNTKLQEFKDVLLSGKFITTTKEKNCAYCKYGDICNKGDMDTKEEDE